MALLRSWDSRIRVQDLQGEHDRRVGVDGRSIRADSRHLANLHVIADSPEPAATADAELVQETPVAHRYICHETWRAIKLPVSLHVLVREVFHDVLRSPISSGHYRAARFDSIDFSISRVGDGDSFRLGWIAIMLHPNGS